MQPSPAHPSLPHAYCLPVGQREALTRHPLVNDGHLYIQNLASQWTVHVLAPQPGETILDLAAAPGGKTTDIAARMQNTGVLSAVEAVRPRFFKLRANLEACGVAIAKTYLMDGRAVGRKTPSRFDRILLDAPCSSEARIKPGEPKSWEHWSLRKIKEASRKQRGLILSAYAALKPGGALVYSTCSFAPEENEAVVAHLLEKCPEAHVINTALPLDNVQPGLLEWEKMTFPEAISRTTRILPNPHMHGFFIATILKPA